MQKTVKQICEEQGILGQIILDEFEKNSASLLVTGSSLSDCISEMHWEETKEGFLFWLTLRELIKSKEKELKTKSLAEQHIESSGLKEAVENMQVLAEQPSRLAKEIMNSFEGVSIEPTKSISKGSIVTIDGKEYELQGDAVLVGPVTDLIQGKRYLIKYSKQFCFSIGEIDRTELKQKPEKVIFVGEITLGNQEKRNIFYHQGLKSTFFMFGTKLDYIVKQLD